MRLPCPALPCLRMGLVSASVPIAAPGDRMLAHAGLSRLRTEMRGSRGNGPPVLSDAAASLLHVQVGENASLLS